MVHIVVLASMCLEPVVTFRMFDKAEFPPQFKSQAITELQSSVFIAPQSAIYAKTAQGHRANADSEVVVGHKCLGTRNVSYVHKAWAARYYSSSFCYWLPNQPEFEGLAGLKRMIEREKSLTGPWGGFGLKWVGGKSPDTEMCPGLAKLARLNSSLFGKCVRCVACHDNARQSRKIALARPSYDVLPMPEDCFTEVEIDNACSSDFNSQNEELVTEANRCHGVKIPHEKAVANLQKYEQQLAFHSDHLIRSRTALPGAQRELQYLERDLADAKSRFRWSKSNTEHACRYCRRHSVQNALSGAQYVCKKKDHRRCRPAIDERNRMARRVQSAQEKVATHKLNIQTIEDGMIKSQTLAGEAQAKLPGARTEKERMDAEWLPQEVKCLATIDEALLKWRIFAHWCIPSWYPKSCEKVCIELTTEQGCGVAEGASVGDATGRGGPEITCNPPSKSWVKSAGFINGTGESRNDQCSRIEETQKQAHLQTILKAGWVHRGKPNGFGMKRKIWMALESGTPTRSATLRFFRKGKENPAGGELTGKFITLWDALEVNPTSRSGTFDQCMTLKHNYNGHSTKYQDKDILICVDESGEAGAEVVKSWIEAIKPLIGVAPGWSAA